MLNKKKGFYLVEAMVSLGILSLLLSTLIAISGFNSKLRIENEVLSEGLSLIEFYKQHYSSNLEAKDLIHMINKSTYFEIEDKYENFTKNDERYTEVIDGDSLEVKISELTEFLLQIDMTLEYKGREFTAKIYKGKY